MNQLASVTRYLFFQVLKIVDTKSALLSYANMQDF